jgi:hypothetical protein
VSVTDNSIACLYCIAPETQAVPDPSGLKESGKSQSSPDFALICSAPDALSGDLSEAEAEECSSEGDPAMDQPPSASADPSDQRGSDPFGALLATAEQQSADGERSQANS